MGGTQLDRCFCRVSGIIVLHKNLNQSSGCLLFKYALKAYELFAIQLRLIPVKQSVVHGVSFITPDALRHLLEMDARNLFRSVLSFFVMTRPFIFFL